MRWIVRGLAVVLLLGLSAEAASWLMSSMPADHVPGTSCVVLVLGFPSQEDGSPHPVQRMRVETGVEVFREQACGRIVLSGGAAHNAFVEADAMARLVEQLGVAAESIVLEREARTTWENVALAIPAIENFDLIFIASEGLHARRAVRYLCRQRPDLCARCVAVANYEPLRLFWWKKAAALYEMLAWLRDAAVATVPTSGKGEHARDRL